MADNSQEREFKPIFIARNMEARILIGIACVAATTILIFWIAINENSRMKEFTQRAEARSIEQGAVLFEANCTTCHGTDSRGLAGVAPGLNSPHLFGYNFFTEIDGDISLVEARLESASDPAQRAELSAELDDLQLDRQLLADEIYYNYGDTVAELDADLTALEAEINQFLADEITLLQTQLEDGEGDEAGDIQTQLDLLDGVTAARLPIFIQQREANELAPLLSERDALLAAAEEATSDEGDTEGAEDDAGDDSGMSAQDELRLAELDEAIATVEDELSPYQGYVEARSGLIAERGRFQAVTDAFNELAGLRAELDAVQDELDALPEPPEEGVDEEAVRREELAAQVTEISSQLETAEVAATQAREALLENNDISPWNGYDPVDPGSIDRLDQVNWSGSLYAYLEGTLIGGRPGSANYWPQAMVAWSNETGGPLRPDQVRNLVDYIINYERDFTIEDLRAVRQFARLPVDGATAGGGESAIGTDNVTLIREELAAALDAGEATEGVAASGESLFVTYGCSGCHGEQPGTGPALTGMWARAENNEDGRLTDSGYEGDPEGYTIQSIAQPNAYLVGGYAAGQMPQNFTTDQMSPQDLLDIVAYIRTQD